MFGIFTRSESLPATKNRAPKIYKEALSDLYKFQCALLPALPALFIIYAVVVSTDVFKNKICKVPALSKLNLNKKCGLYAICDQHHKHFCRM